jgi:hypothetical protein
MLIERLLCSNAPRVRNDGKAGYPVVLVQFLGQAWR